MPAKGLKFTYSFITIGSFLLSILTTWRATESDLSVFPALAIFGGLISLIFGIASRVRREKLGALALVIGLLWPFVLIVGFIFLLMIAGPKTE